MTDFKKTTLAFVLLAGSALSPLPVLAQDASSQNGGTNVLPQQSQQQPPKAGTSADAKLQAGASGMDTDAAQTKAPTEQQKAAGTESQPARSPSQQAQSEEMKKDGSVGTDASKSASSENAPSATQQRQSAQGTAPSAESDANKSSSARSVNSPSTDTAASPDNKNRTVTASANNERPSNEVTGSISISTEQKTEIRSVIVENKVETIKPSFSVSVGVAVPRTVKLHPLPPKVVEIVPAYRSYQYLLLADNRIVIVDPATFEIVYILVV